MEAPGRCGDWLTPPPSPPRPHASGRHDKRGVRTFSWPPAGTSTWPPAGTFPWPRTPMSTSTAWTPDTDRGRGLPCGHLHQSGQDGANKAGRAVPGHRPGRPGVGAAQYDDTTFALLPARQRRRTDTGCRSRRAACTRCGSGVARPPRLPGAANCRTRRRGCARGMRRRSAKACVCSAFR